ncbi:alpha/beta fold hydrolase [Litorilituus lipolyticus]|uniref:Alpha/beta hydrolase n=1 Tax=Litorilituus lipolyticus TaxID=2491017 RepID=A0A502KQW9_9GAMM|nr:hypothetical protein [Litorilituus lipolyticus]TPH13982.1 hypothetical protein EPA86_12790 [Litorilituus lipolyticus]
MSSNSLASQPTKTETVLINGKNIYYEVYGKGTPLEEVLRARKYLPNSELWIIPDTGHGGYDQENKEAFIRMSKSFLAKGESR